MGLFIFDDVSKDAFESAFWWNCNNPDCFLSRPEEAIAAPEYDWLYWYKVIPKKDLKKDPGLKAEYDQARLNYLNRRQRARQERKAKSTSI